MNSSLTSAKTAGLAALGTVVLLSSCSLPPREAWRKVRSEGLIAVIREEGDAPNVEKDPAVAPEKKVQVAESRVIYRAPERSGNLERLDIPVGPGPELQRLPVAQAAPGKPGYVLSPFQSGALVDVRGFAEGTEVKCPYTDKSFLVPDPTMVPPIRMTPNLPPREVADSDRPPRMIERKDPEPVPSTPATAKVDPTPKIDAPKPPVVDAGSPTSPEPKVTPQPKPEPKVTPQPKPAVKEGAIPFGSRIAGRPGYVNSPFAAKNQLVDVTGLPEGTEVKCPYTGKLFRVPKMLPEDEKPEPKTDAPKKDDKTASAEGSYPTAGWAQDRPGYVVSPFSSGGELINVSGKAPGSVARCPFTGKLFKVPGQF
ncbi:MAG: hypothetical protein R3F11_28615 [Verrucomicrobiales bacterium]